MTSRRSHRGLTKASMIRTRERVRVLGPSEIKRPQTSLVASRFPDGTIRIEWTSQTVHNVASRWENVVVLGVTPMRRSEADQLLASIRRHYGANGHPCRYHPVPEVEALVAGMRYQFAPVAAG